MFQLSRVRGNRGYGDDYVSVLPMARKAGLRRVSKVSATSSTVEPIQRKFTMHIEKAEVTSVPSTDVLGSIRFFPSTSDASESRWPDKGDIPIRSC